MEAGLAFFGPATGLAWLLFGRMRAARPGNIPRGILQHAQNSLFRFPRVGSGLCLVL